MIEALRTSILVPYYDHLHISHVGEVPQPRAERVNVSALLAGGSLELGHQAGGHPAAGFCLDALCPGPLAIWVVFGPLPGPRLLRASLRALLPARRAELTYRVSASRDSLACPAFKSISYSVPSSPNRTVPSAALPSRSSMSRICIF